MYYSLFAQCFNKYMTVRMPHYMLYVHCLLYVCCINKFEARSLFSIFHLIDKYLELI